MLVFDFFILGVNPAAIVAKFRGLYKTIDQVRSAFQQYDVDGDRTISRWKECRDYKTQKYPSFVSANENHMPKTGKNDSKNANLVCC